MVQHPIWILTNGIFPFRKFYFYQLMKLFNWKLFYFIVLTVESLNVLLFILDDYLWENVQKIIEDSCVISNNVNVLHIFLFFYLIYFFNEICVCLIFILLFIHPRFDSLKNIWIATKFVSFALLLLLFMCRIFFTVSQQY